MDQYPIYKTLILDALPYAWRLETEFGGYLNPAVRKRGVWFPQRTTPDTVPAFLFYKPMADSPEWKQVELTAETLQSSDIEGDLCDANGKVIVSAAMRRKIAMRGVLPIVGLRMVRAAVDDRIAEMSRAWTRRCAPGLLEQWSRYLDPRLLDVQPAMSVAPDQRQHVRDQLIDNRDTVISAMRDTLTELTQQVREFMGTQPRDKWVMHFLKTSGSDLHVQKSEDFRVYDWTRRINSGEWV